MAECCRAATLCLYDCIHTVCIYYFSSAFSYNPVTMFSSVHWKNLTIIRTFMKTSRRSDSIVFFKAARYGRKKQLQFNYLLSFYFQYKCRRHL